MILVDIGLYFKSAFFLECLCYIIAVATLSFVCAFILSLC